VVWIHLAEDWASGRLCEHKVKLQALLRVGNFLIVCMTVSFSVKTVSRAVTIF
jgi:hypothetical protein